MFPPLLFKHFPRPGGTDGVGGAGNRAQVFCIAPLMPTGADDTPSIGSPPNVPGNSPAAPVPGRQVNTHLAEHCPPKVPPQAP